MLSAFPMPLNLKEIRVIDLPKHLEDTVRPMRYYFRRILHNKVLLDHSKRAEVDPAP